MLLSENSLKAVVTTMMALLCLAPSAFALDEVFELYTPPQVAAMGGAITANATGYLSNYYNPAGLAKATNKNSEIHLLALEGNFGTTSIGTALSAKSLGLYRTIDALTRSSGSYSYLSIANVPAYTRRGFGISLLSSYRFAGVYDGTNVNLDSVADLGPSVGFAMNLFKNVLKVGVAGKALVRNQWKGAYAPTELTSEDGIQALGKEGLGLGGDLGAMITIPDRFLPTLAFTWRDIMGTKFSKTTVFNGLATEAPDNIPQSFNVGGSVSPFFGRRLRATFSAEFKHIERNDLGIKKRLHLGFQLEDARNWYYWIGLNQMYLTLGVALRLPGGNLELASYGQEIGTSDAPAQDRRFMFRYTISF